jgi:glucose 1-dehydrogenase
LQIALLDILVNNAGIEKHAPFWEATEADYDAVMNVNLKGVFFATQSFVQHLIETKRIGKIINISSVHEELPFPNFTAYCASKGGMKMLTRNLSR